MRVGKRIRRRGDVRPDGDGGLLHHDRVWHSGLPTTGMYHRFAESNLLQPLLATLRATERTAVSAVAAAMPAAE